MTTLLIAADGRSSLELACAAADRFVLWRRGGEVRLLVDDRHATAVRRALAFQGVSVAAGEGGLPEPPKLFAAIGTGLAATVLADDTELDLLEVRVVPLGDATRGLLRRPFRSFPLGPRRRARCRALLRGTDVLLEVRRSAWCGRATLSRARRDLRPLLFDRTATPPAHRVFAMDGVISRWING
ncbi:MAG TPA: hypothetical protein VIM50_06920 [Candidatus Limnocylindria bacterium]|jgi:hypothetical protein